MFLIKIFIYTLISLVGYYVIVFSLFPLTFPLLFLEPSEDGFGKDITIPPEMVIEEPIPEGVKTNGPTSNDPEGKELVAAISKSLLLSARSEINTDIQVLDKFAGLKRSLLLHHLACSAKWYMTKEGNKIYAYRRFVTEDGRWKNSLHGFYSDSDFNSWGFADYQFRIILGIDGSVMDRPWRKKATYSKVGSGEISLKITKDTGERYESYLVLLSSGLTLEIFEESTKVKRSFTRLALKQIEEELESLLQSDTTIKKKFDLSLMPSESIRKGNPNIWLVNGMQGGIYLVYAYVNPGESGYVYLKVFEATRNNPLSTTRIPNRSTEYIGWSNNSREQFFYNTEITVYEGDWGVYYPARFELWFVPDSGKPERKLIEKIFKIEGWQR